MVTELNRTGFTAMFATYTAFQIIAHRTSFIHCHLYKLTDTILIKNLEWIDFQNLLL